MAGLPFAPPPDLSALAQLAAAQTPTFTQEGPEFYAAAFAQNKPFATPGPYQTSLHPAEEAAFRQWVAKNRVPFDPNAPVADYDMRAFWKATGGAPHPPGAHFPDTFKTPYDTSFSNESRYAKPNNPNAWQGDKLVNQRNGKVVFADIKAAAKAAQKGAR